MPKTKAVIIYPSSPINFAKGSKKFAIWVNKVISFKVVFARSQMIIPAGAAIFIALARTKRVLSNIERINIFPIWGFLYGGSSKINEDGNPFSIVLDRIFDMTKVKMIPIKTTNKTRTVAAKEDEIPLFMTSKENYSYCD